jgi:alpha-N-acetylglucosamine transferase
VLAHVRAIRHWSFVTRPIVLLVDERMALAKDAKLQQQFVDEGVSVQTFRGIYYDKSRLLMLKNVNRLHLWRLPFDRVVFVAPEVALLRNLEYLFQYPDFAVVPNSEAPEQFRTSLMVLRPSADTFARMLHALERYQPTWDTSEQAFLAQFFNNTQTLLPWSSCPSVRALYMRPELWDFRDITCLHWSQFQPWTWQKRTDLLYMLFHWYDYLARYVPEYEVPASDYAPGWPHQQRAKQKAKKQ